MKVDMRSLVRLADGSFIDIVEATVVAGDCSYVRGAISLRIDTVELFGPELWDDVNWLWPLLIRALDDCQATGMGRRGFPSQPIAIVAERAWSGHTRLSVTDGDAINRSAVATDHDLLSAVTAAGLEFFRELRRLCPHDDTGEEERLIIESWNRERPASRKLAGS